MKTAFEVYEAAAVPAMERWFEEVSRQQNLSGPLQANLRISLLSQSRSIWFKYKALIDVKEIECTLIEEEPNVKLLVQIRGVRPDGLSSGVIVMRMDTDDPTRINLVDLLSLDVPTGPNLARFANDTYVAMKPYLARIQAQLDKIITKDKVDKVLANRRQAAAVARANKVAELAQTMAKCIGIITEEEVVKMWRDLVVRSVMEE